MCTVACPVIAEFKPENNFKENNLSTFSTVGLVARRSRRDVVETVYAVQNVLVGLGAEVIFEDATLESIQSFSQPAQDSNKITASRSVSRAELGEHCDLIVVVGGDGSILGVSREIAHSGVPVVGVNRGGLGFLAAVSPGDLEEQLQNIWAGQYSIEDHFLLQAEATRDGAVLTQSNALNDVVVHAGSLARMIEFELWVDDEFIYAQRSDGLIVASPTGSTAYSLSAGGPIMHPSLDAIVIVPMFPHTLTSRPLVIRGESAILIKVTNTNNAMAQISCDSQVNAGLSIGDEISVVKYSTPLRLLYPAGHSFFESCRSKLDWANRLGGQSL